jgi:hypothetical protein
MRVHRCSVVDTILVLKPMLRCCPQWTRSRGPMNDDVKAQASNNKGT